MSARSRRLLVSVLAPVAAFLVSLVIATLVIKLSGNDPFKAYARMWRYTNQPDSRTSILNRASSLYIAGIAVAIGFKMNLFNIGVEGQYRLAGLFAAYIGAQLKMPAILHVPFIMIVAMVVGAFWAGIAGYLKVKRNVNEVISTIMLNFAASGLIVWLLNFHFRTQNKKGVLGAKTKVIARSGWMPSLNRPLGWIGIHPPGGRDSLYGYVLVAVLLGVAYHVVLTRTRFGFDLRASGGNPSAARASGVNPGRMIITTMLISGAIAGLIGMPDLMGQTHFFDEAFPAGRGFDGIAVALLGQNHAVGVGVAAILFGYLDRSSNALQLVNVAPEVVAIMKGTIMLTAVITFVLLRRWATTSAVKTAAAQIETTAGAAA
jgi:general nucleoside transport system permease protein